jgi:hypothetical protein
MIMRYDKDDRVHLSSQEPRGGEIILRQRWQRLVFLAGLAGFVLLAAGLTIFAH